MNLTDVCIIPAREPSVRVTFFDQQARRSLAEDLANILGCEIQREVSCGTFIPDSPTALSDDATVNGCYLLKNGSTTIARVRLRPKDNTAEITLLHYPGGSIDFLQRYCRHLCQYVQK